MAKKIKLDLGDTSIEREISAEVYLEILSLINSDIFEGRWSLQSIVFETENITIQSGVLNIDDLNLGISSIEGLAIINSDGNGFLVILPDFYCLFFKKSGNKHIFLLNSDDNDWEIRQSSLLNFFRG